MPDHNEIADFFEHMRVAGSGHVNTAVIYDAVQGWRVMFGMDGKMMAMGHAQARKMGEYMKSQMAGRDGMKEVVWLADQLLELANECRMKNRDKIVPDGYVEAMPVAGNA